MAAVQAVAVLAVSPAVAVGAHRAAEADSATGEDAAAVAARAVSRAAVPVVDVVAPAGSRGAVPALVASAEAAGEAVVSAGVVDAEVTERRLMCWTFSLRLGLSGLFFWFGDGVKGVIVHLGVQIPIRY